ncbi:hypothetical protein AB1Y20_005160 [Prymnesium parvum]|uniref:Peptide-O-fucosyltransferase 1 n=1 Tax=Prymnesium parvum TaxID=97485 RepID=A0AB34J2Z5_PRYPA
MARALWRCGATRARCLLLSVACACALQLCCVMRLASSSADLLPRRSLPPAQQQPAASPPSHRRRLPSPEMPRCVLLERAPPPAPPPAERFLAYAPQFGLSNQLVALRAAVVWSLLLNRTLVLPHLLAHAACARGAAAGCDSGARARVPFGAAFDVRRARAEVRPLRLVEMDDFAALPHEALPHEALPHAELELPTRAKYSVPSGAYFRSLGSRWAEMSSRAPVAVAMESFTKDAVQQSFGGCPHRVLAFRSLFAAYDGKRASDFPSPGLAWLDQTALPALLTPRPQLQRLVDQITHELARGKRGGAHGCAHIRRGDFAQECLRYEQELAGGAPRAWVVWHARRRLSCYQDDAELAANLRQFSLEVASSSRTSVGEVPLYASIEDSSFLESAALRPFNFSSLKSFSKLVDGSSISMPPGVRDVLLDQLVCSRAKWLLLNAYSTFSQLVMSRIGMSVPSRVGWTRELTKQSQQKLGVHDAIDDIEKRTALRAQTFTARQWSTRLRRATLLAQCARE